MAQITFNDAGRGQYGCDSIMISSSNSKEPAMPEPLTEQRLAEIRALVKTLRRVRSVFGEESWGFDSATIAVNELLAEVDRLRDRLGEAHDGCNEAPAEVATLTDGRDELRAVLADHPIGDHTAALYWGMLQASRLENADLRAKGSHLTAENQALRAAYDAKTRAYAAADGPSPLPTGRKDYRNLEDFEAELKEIVAK